ncbi:MAG: hypothetical protein K8H74_11220 [Notoacmeibacter sp.]|nr:hypothetical protein [Notoacmeibacter sp.]
MRNLFAFRAAIAAICITAALPQAATAKDWIEKVQIAKDGIDIVPIEVSANAAGYTAVKTGSHKFGLRLYARATNGERIVAMKAGSYKDVLYFEYATQWNEGFSNRDVGAGSKRTVDLHIDRVIPLKKLTWQGSDPRARCALNLESLIAKGMSKTAALAKIHTVKAYAYFELDAVAARKNKAENGKWSLKNTTSQRDAATYEVLVKCLPGIKRKGS